MARQVAAYIAEERRRLGEETGEEEEEVDAETIADISRTLAEARARGAPTPNAAVFVDRAVQRRREALTLLARMDREASGMDPELEAAFVAAQRASQAAAKAPRRLGGAPQPP